MAEERPMLTLYYFPVRARAEPIRLILAYGNIQYEDVTIDFDRWAGEKTDRDKFRFGQLPVVLLPNGVSIAQSGAITRYVAKLAGVYPSDPDKAAVADMVQELAMEMNIINPILNWFPVDSEQRAREYTTYFDAFDGRMVALRRILGSQQYFGGDGPSHGDFCMLHVLDVTLTVKPDALDSHLELKGWVERMKGIPQVHRYLSERPQPPHIGREGSLMKSLK